MRKVTPQGDAQVMEADLVISFKVFRERFGSRVTLWPEDLRIDTEYLEGPFKFMKSNWAFAEAPGGCEVSFFVDFEFRNAILQKVIGVVFNEAMHRIVRKRRVIEKVFAVEEGHQADTAVKEYTCGRHQLDKRLIDDAPRRAQPKQHGIKNNGRRKNHSGLKPASGPIITMKLHI